MSEAPALNAAVHISSSARRCVQTTLSPGNSRERLSTSTSEAISTSKMITRARCFEILARNSSIDRTAWTERNELSNEAARDCAISGLPWRRTTLDFIFPLNFHRRRCFRLRPLHTNDNGADVNLRRRWRQPFYLRLGAFSARDSNGSAWS